MNTQQQLDPIVEKWALLKHPFYQAWSAGTLPVDALKVYASEYGAFIGTLTEGWMTLNDPETAREEQEHTEPWDQFADVLGAKIGAPEIAETKELMKTSHILFANPATALGAMYAFEVQQPETAKSKLQGLKTHYSLPVEAEPYFEVHSSNWHESQKILASLERLPAEEQVQARQACEKMSESLWNALTGIYEQTCIQQ